MFRKRATVLSQLTPNQSPVIGGPHSYQQRPVSAFPGPRRFSPVPTGKKPFPENFPGELAPQNLNLKELDYDMKSKRNTMAVMGGYRLPDLQTSPSFKDEQKRLSQQRVMYGPGPGGAPVLQSAMTGPTPNLANNHLPVSPYGSINPPPLPNFHTSHSNSPSPLQSPLGNPPPNLIGSQMRRASADMLSSPSLQAQRYQRSTSLAPEPTAGSSHQAQMGASDAFYKMMDHYNLPQPTGSRLDPKLESKPALEPYRKTPVHSRSPSVEAGARKNQTLTPNRLSDLAHDLPMLQIEGLDNKINGIDALSVKIGQVKSNVVQKPASHVPLMQALPQEDISGLLSRLDLALAPNLAPISVQDDALIIEQKLRAIFDAYKGERNRLSTAQLPAAIHSADPGLSFDKPIAQILIKAFDKDNVGGVEFKEFYHLFSYVTKWCKIFKKVSKVSNNNAIALPQYQEALEALGYRLSTKTVSYMFGVFASSSGLEIDAQIGIKLLTLELFVESLAWLMKSTGSFKKFDNQRIGVGVFPFDNYVEEILGFRF